MEVEIGRYKQTKKQIANRRQLRTKKMQWNVGKIPVEYANQIPKWFMNEKIVRRLTN